MKLARELIRLMSDYYALNKLKMRMSSPSNEDYIKLLKTNIVSQYLSPLGYVTGVKDFDIEIRDVPKDLFTRIDLVMKGAIFLYVNEILSWNEVKVLLNIDSTGVILYKKEPTDDFGAYDIIISLLSVLFGKISYTTVTPVDYGFVRFTNDNYYWDLPIYYYGYKLALSYTNIDDMLENIDWFLDENPDVQTDNLPDKYGILGMLRINNKFTKKVIEANNLTSYNIKTEMEDLGLYNVSLNLIKVEETWGLNNTLFDFYKGTKETTNYTEDGLVFTEIPWSVVRTYSKYVDAVMDLDTNIAEIEKIGNILRNIQNFLIH